jgi:CheY-like chemotaxis protein
MNLLIVEDNECLAEITVEILLSLDREARRIETITRTSDLETALQQLPRHDAVLCDGQFPISPGSRFIAEEWDVVRCEAIRHGLRFILYTGSARALQQARESGTPTLSKPAPVEEIYAVLVAAQPLATFAGLAAFSDLPRAAESPKQEAARREADLR